MKRRKPAPSAAVLPFQKPTRKARIGIARLENERRILARGELRHDAITRSGGRCENPICEKRLVYRGCVFDHWLGGSGRRDQAESLQTVWVLCLECNHARTHNAPSAAYWNARFKAHCDRHGYPFTPHITRLEALVQEAS
jgi:hypothetical protein